MAETPANPDPAGERELSAQLALLALERVAPDEVLTFDEVAAEYFADPAATLKPEKRDESVGFGLEVALLTPIALAVAEFVIKFIGELLTDAVKDVAKPGIVNLIRRMLRLPTDPKSPSDLPEWTPEQRARILAAAETEAVRLGLTEDMSTLLGHAILGVLDDGST